MVGECYSPLTFRVLIKLSRWQKNTCEVGSEYLIVGGKPKSLPKVFVLSFQPNEIVLVKITDADSNFSKKIEISMNFGLIINYILVLNLLGDLIDPPSILNFQIQLQYPLLT